MHSKLRSHSHYSLYGILTRSSPAGNDPLPTDPESVFIIRAVQHEDDAVVADGAANAQLYVYCC